MLSYVFLNYSHLFLFLFTSILFQNLKKEKKKVNSIFRIMHLRACPSKNTGNNCSTDSHYIWARMLQVDTKFSHFSIPWRSRVTLNITWPYSHVFSLLNQILCTFSQCSKDIEAITGLLTVARQWPASPIFVLCREISVQRTTACFLNLFENF